MTRKGLAARLLGWARALKREALALWIAARDPRTPLAARAVAGLTAAYVLSPIDLIPDFIPVLGLLDDAILAPLGILLAIRLTPPALMAEFRAGAARQAQRPVSRIAAAVIVALWLIGAVLTLWWLRTRLA